MKVWRGRINSEELLAPLDLQYGLLLSVVQSKWGCLINCIINNQSLSFRLKLSNLSSNHSGWQNKAGDHIEQISFLFISSHDVHEVHIMVLIDMTSRLILFCLKINQSIFFSYHFFALHWFAAGRILIWSLGDLSIRGDPGGEICSSGEASGKQ